MTFTTSLRDGIGRTRSFVPSVRLQSDSAFVLVMVVKRVDQISTEQVVHGYDLIDESVRELLTQRATLTSAELAVVAVAEGVDLAIIAQDQRVGIPMPTRHLHDCLSSQSSHQPVCGHY